MMRRLLLILIAVIVTGYVGAVGYLYAFQESYVYQPSGALATPAEEGLPSVEVVTLRWRTGRR